MKISQENQDKNQEIDSRASAYVKREKLAPKTKIALIAITAFLLYVFTYRALGLPSNEELIVVARHLYATHGYLVAFVGAFLEAILFLGLYLPGSGVVILGAVFSAEGFLDLWVFIFFTVLGFLCAYIVNYLLGRFGWHRVLVKFGSSEKLNEAARRLENAGLAKRIWLFSVSYFHPNTAAVWATTSGILGIRFREFFIVATIATTVWTTLWAVLAYSFGSLVLEILNSWLIIPLILTFFLLVSFDIRLFLKKTAKLFSKIVLKIRMSFGRG